MIGVRRGEATEFLKKPPLPVGEITKPAADGPPVSSPSPLTTEIFFLINILIKCWLGWRWDVPSEGDTKF